MPRMLRIKEAAELTGLSYHHLRRLCLEDKVFYIMAGNRYLINYDSLAAYLNGEG